MSQLYARYNEDGVIITVYDHPHEGCPEAPMTEEQASNWTNCRVNMLTKLVYTMPTAPNIYHKLVNGQWEEMSPTEKAEVDAAAFVRRKTERGNEIFQQTNATIEARLPQWRLNRWRRYYDLSRKVSALGYDALTGIDKAEYDAFPDPGETHEQCAAYVPLALQWAIDCIEAHKAAMVALSTAATLVEINAVEVAYPVWPIS